MKPRTYGLVLVTVATVMWSSAGLFVRMLDLDVWTTLGWRSVFGGLTLLIISLFGRRAAPPTATTPYGMYALLGLFSALSMFGYMASLKLTTVANVLSIYATVPFIAAGLAYLLIGERVERRVLSASCVAFLGVLVVAGFAARLTDLAGNALALLMTVTFSILLVMARKHPSLRMAPVNALGSGLCVLLCLPLMSHALPSPSDLAILALFGSTTSGIAYLLYMTGGRYIPSGEAGLIGLMDVVLGPLWVWLAFSEWPGNSTIAGASLILVAVAWYLWSGLRNSTARKAAIARASRPF
ncbi:MULTISPECIES: DMT family transporter [Rhizobium]|uniref:DMT family transporter n=1 Tax=Rhizobium rhododendri TaxID=2506430 RepID=A0ABY8II36_9HYPH|nr:MULTISPECIES: DMT family transporter [Rhizobium]MBZ5759704.1 DMT family transporter [Rhizobium sp. VS19-DR96]MBZ5766092.1 DMT family transporter [Rhizobium sp. VS19-DR129.2]MBZ5772875.1 DMT family transporter [Rhizobium sp. VS19-DRK62.2]MBZ5786615.1 DMT family transporter [Rhizobium sp. VS19-DR121]MBZ5804361.1 DMT family transporter [Rhizobium sp. VS19-DR181]